MLYNINKKKDPKPLTKEQMNKWNQYMAGKDDKMPLDGLFAGYKDKDISFEDLKYGLDLEKKGAQKLSRKQHGLDGLIKTEDVHTGNKFLSVFQDDQNLGLRSLVEPETRQKFVKEGAWQRPAIISQKDWTTQVPPEIKSGDVFFDDVKQNPYFLDPATGDAKYIPVDIWRKKYGGKL
jgi:hypothetical protein